MRTVWLFSAVVAMTALPLAARAGAGGAATTPPATLEVAGVMSITPPAAASYLAVALPLGGDAVVRGVRWFNNDGATVFPRVLLAVGEPGQPPAPALAQIVLAEVQGQSSAWSEWSLPEAVSCETGLLYVLFQQPPFAQREGEGSGSGPGIGYVLGSGADAYISLDGQQWSEVGVGAAAALILAADEPAARVLARPDGIVTASAEPTEVAPAPGEVSLHAEPNPFNPSARLVFDLPRASVVSLGIHDLRGRAVKTLVHGQLPAGRHDAIWDGRDFRGRLLPSGVYLARLETVDGVCSLRLGLLK